MWWLLLQLFGSGWALYVVLCDMRRRMSDLHSALRSRRARRTQQGAPSPRQPWRTTELGYCMVTIDNGTTCFRPWPCPLHGERGGATSDGTSVTLCAYRGCDKNGDHVGQPWPLCPLHAEAIRRGEIWPDIDEPLQRGTDHE
jgi:hypothetical protein